MNYLSTYIRLLSIFLVRFSVNLTLQSVLESLRKTRMVRCKGLMPCFPADVRLIAICLLQDIGLSIIFSNTVISYSGWSFSSFTIVCFSHKNSFTRISNEFLRSISLITLNYFSHLYFGCLYIANFINDEIYILSCIK